MQRLTISILNLTIADLISAIRRWWKNRPPEFPGVAICDYRFTCINHEKATCKHPKDCEHYERMKK